MASSILSAPGGASPDYSKLSARFMTLVFPEESPHETGRRLGLDEDTVAAVLSDDEDHIFFGRFLTPLRKVLTDTALRWVWNMCPIPGPPPFSNPKGALLDPSAPWDHYYKLKAAADAKQLAILRSPFSTAHTSPPTAEDLIRIREEFTTWRAKQLTALRLFEAAELAAIGCDPTYPQTLEVINFINKPTEELIKLVGHWCRLLTQPCQERPWLVDVEQTRRAILACQVRLSGWTHCALRCADGAMDMMRERSLPSVSVMFKDASAALRESLKGLEAIMGPDAVSHKAAHSWKLLMKSFSIQWIREQYTAHPSTPCDNSEN